MLIQTSILSLEVRTRSFSFCMWIDLFITGSEDLIAECKLGLASEFEMSDIGLMHYFLGMEVWQEEGHIFLG
jgi:hypothetical protein